MASWSTKRKYAYLIALIAAIVFLVALPLFVLFYKAPTCSDGKRNGKETGIDCGGSCARLCVADFSSLKTLWSYAMPIVPGVYNAMAYVQNPNQNVESVRMEYTFKLYDSSGLLVVERKGGTYVPAGQKFAVFESGLKTGSRQPVKTVFEFTSAPVWKKGDTLSKIKTVTVDIDETSSPRVEVKIKNESSDTDYRTIDAFVILYDKDENRVAFSKTVIEEIARGESQTIAFTWPNPFERPVIKTEVLFVDRP